MENISTKELFEEYKRYYKTRQLFEQKINLHSYFKTFCLWLYYYVNDNKYGTALADISEEDKTYKNSMSVDICKVIARDFYYDLGQKLGEKFDSIINNKDKTIINIDKNIIGQKIQDTSFSSISDDLVDSNLYGIINIKNYNTIETLYGIVHEIMHAITTVNNKYTEATFIIREVPSFFVESLLNDYLFNNYKKYNLNKENIVHDINLWKLIRCFEYIDIEKSTYNSEYFLGIILTAKFEELSNYKKKQQLRELVYYLNNDRLDIALKSIDFKLGNESDIEKSPYLKSLVSIFMNLVNSIKKKDNLIVQIDSYNIIKNK